MDFRKWLFLSVLLFSCYGISQAGELAAKQAVNYYNDAVKDQKACNIAEANANYQKVLLVDPYNPDWKKFILNNQGIMYAQQGDLEKAEAAFNEALKIDPEYETAKLNLGFIYEQRRSRLESIEYWLKVLNIDLDKVKPKGFVVEEGQKKEETKKLE